MNRRDFFKGLVAASATLTIPIPAIQGLAEMGVLPSNSFVDSLRNDLMYRIINPSCILNEDGTLTQISTKEDMELLKWINENFEVEL